MKTSLVLGLCFLLGLPSNMATDDSPGNRRIIGGVPADIKDHAWQVALHVTWPSGDTYLCGGSIIDRTWILTAAHCFPSKPTTVVTRVKAGVTDISSGSWIVAEKVIRHEAYDENTHENDIALVKLKAPRAAGEIISRADTTLTLRHTDFEVTGWGTTSEGGKTPRALMMVSVPYVEQDVCNNAYGGAIKGTMLCAGKKGSDSCQGDSGGPLVLKSANGPILVGVVSFGEGCGREDKYGVYTRVSSYQRWIQDNTATR